MPSTRDPADPRVTSGAAWDALVAALGRARERVLGTGAPDAPRDRAEGFQYLLRFLASGIALCVEHADADHPSFVRMVDFDRRWGLDCPDCLYLYATVRGDAVYRVSGRRGSANHLDLQVNWGHFANGSIAEWGTTASLAKDDLACDAEGRFELLLGGEPRARNWLPLAPNAEFVLLRQYFDDWEREEPGDFAIERVGAPPSVPPASMTTDGSSALISTVTPIAARSCWIAWAMRGLGSVFMAYNTEANPSG